MNGFVNGLKCRVNTYGIRATSIVVPFHSHSLFTPSCLFWVVHSLPILVVEATKKQSVAKNRPVFVQEKRAHSISRDQGL